MFMGMCVDVYMSAGIKWNQLPYLDPPPKKNKKEIEKERKKEKEIKVPKKTYQAKTDYLNVFLFKVQTESHDLIHHVLRKCSFS